MTLTAHTSINLLHWSDLHDAHPATDQLVDHVLATYSPGDTVILITGDLTNSGTDREYGRMRASLLPLAHHGYRVLAVPGNHDCGPMGIDWEESARKRFDAYILRDVMGLRRSMWPLVVEGGAWRVILLDSQEGNSDDLIVMARGELGTRQLARLELALQDESKPTIVALHHHPIKADILHALDEHEELCELLGRRDCVKAALFGHMHARGVWRNARGIPYAADAGKTTEPREGALVYTLHRLGADGSHVTREVKVSSPAR